MCAPANPTFATAPTPPEDQLHDDLLAENTRHSRPGLGPRAGRWAGLRRARWRRTPTNGRMTARGSSSPPGRGPVFKGLASRRSRSATDSRLARISGRAIPRPSPRITSDSIALLDVGKPAGAKILEVLWKRGDDLDVTPRLADLPSGDASLYLHRGRAFGSLAQHPRHQSGRRSKWSGVLLPSCRGGATRRFAADSRPRSRKDVSS